VEELTGMLPLHEAIPLAKKRLDPISFRIWKRGLIDELVRLSHELHSRRRYHKDLYLCHFYLPESLCGAIPVTWENRVVMIDFHRLSFHFFSGLWYRIKDLAQLLYSSEIEGVTPRDRLQFWNRYRERLHFGSGFLGWAIERKYRRYRKHNAK
jgi:heptose I phosphotransferase